MSNDKTKKNIMKRIILSLLLPVLSALPCAAQSTVKYGYLPYDSLLHTMPAYAEAQRQMTELRKKYEDEAQYNELAFKRQFAEFLQGQKDFPQNILLKRQRDLQDAIEKSLAFRHEADSLLQRAEADLVRPAREQLDAAIRAVGLERGYECIVNTEADSTPFIHPSLSENAAPFVAAKIGGK